MSAFLIYLVKVSCWIAAWWLIYFFFLRKETFFRFNRIYLMTGLVASFIIPLMKIHYPVEIFITQTPIVQVTENIQKQLYMINLYSILFFLYILCGVFFLIRQWFLLLKINRRIRSAGYATVNNCRLVDSSDIEAPFTFFNYIFYDFRKVPEEERQLILTHEQSHINQRHWIDLAVAECIRIFLWFNPFAWLYQRSVKENHEYLADAAVIRNGYPPVNYRAALINQSLNILVFQLTNSFASFKYKRINMMKKEISNPLKKLAVLLLVPALGFFLWAFSEPEYTVITVEPANQQDVVYLQPDNQTTVEDVNPNHAVKTEPAVVFRKDTLLFRGVSSATPPLIIIDGKESSASFKITDPNQIESMSILKDASAKTIYGEKGKDGVVIITTKKADQVPEVQAINEDKERVVSVIGFGKMNATPLFVIDGKESSRSDIDKLNPEQIESISILKDASAKAIYGEKGKDSVMIITIKKADQVPEVQAVNKDKEPVVSVIGFGKMNSTPLFIIDGKESSRSDLDKLNPEQIESITVLKDASAKTIYGEKAKNGVIIITTKKETQLPEKSAVDITG